MEGKRFIHRLELTNLLSFGPEGAGIDLEPLNVLIGPNASGKSNVLDAIALLHAAPTDLPAVIRQGGGVGEWLWKGRGAAHEARLVAEARGGRGPSRRWWLTHALEFGGIRERVHITAEQFAVELGPRARRPGTGAVGGEPASGRSRVWTRRELEEAYAPEGQGGRLEFDQSVLRHVRPSPAHFALFELARLYERISIHRDWNLSRDSAPRKPQPADLPQDFLLPDASNLGLVLNDLDYRFGMTHTLVDDLRRLHPTARRIGTRVAGGTVQLFLGEDGLTQPLPATRMSDGTLRFLCMLVILRHPEPPPLVCIEEPEIGLHPDAMPVLAELLVEASSRMQLIVTTHSDALVSALTSTAESVLVCERNPDGTQLRRLEADRLRKWLDEYTLGDLWAMGEIGGTLK